MDTQNAMTNESNSTKILHIGALVLAGFAAVMSLMTYSFVKEAEVAKVGGPENYTLVKKLYMSDGFKSVQKTQIEQALSNINNQGGTAGAANGQPAANTGAAQAPSDPISTLSPDNLKKVLADARFKGNTSSDVVVLEYTDLQCPYCKRQHDSDTLNAVVTASKIAYATKHFPLSFHEYAQKSAEASECAFDQGKYYEFIDAAFVKSPTLPVDALKAIAKDLKLDTTKFDTCLDGGSKATIVKAQETEGGTIFGVSGTPANIVLNRKTGKYKNIAGAVPAETIEAAVTAVAN